LADELARLRAVHGRALLWDGHSIESELPWLFEGRLPDLNLGSFQGAACAAPQLQAVARVLAGQTDYSHVVDGRFKGGYITRRYGQPAQGVHALQMEMVQATYMVEDAQHPSPRPLVEARVQRLQPLLTACLQAFLAAKP
jgi:N-formylglutamate deformylase